MTRDVSDPINRSSRCRWLGPTPAMVVWRLVHPCPPLQRFAELYRTPKNPLAVQHCLKPLESISEAAMLGNVFHDWAVLLPDERRVPGNLRDEPLAFSLTEVTAVFGGLSTTVEACGKCPANIERLLPATSEKTSTLAGCCQVLVFGELDRLSEQTRSFVDAAKPLVRSPGAVTNAVENDAWVDRIAARLFAQGRFRDLVRAASPRGLWQSLWFSQGSVIRWDRTRLVAFHEDLKGDFGSESSETDVTMTGWPPFCAAVLRAIENDWSLETEYLPPGFSDGRDWWLDPHCSHCGAAMERAANSCAVCGRAGGPIPEQKRRIMGWAPYRPLHSLLGREAAARLLETASVQRGSKG